MGVSSAYEEHREGEWHRPIEKGYKMCCCDCGLVHTVDFRIHEGHVELRVFRNNRSTAMVRRHRNIRVTQEEAA